tara:strand:+ start:943 stop:1707 length:765 start_codon:yes stop_codon:yes gene_type:complete
MQDYKYLSKHTKTSVPVEEGRFVNYNEREIKSDIYSDTIKNVSMGKYKIKWKNIDLMKDPLSLICYQQLLNDIPFKTIFELGTYEGGSALWFHDIMTLLCKDFKIYSFDIDSSLLKTESNNNMKFNNLDVNSLNDKTTFFLNDNTLNTYDDVILKYPKPWLVIEDCHVNVVDSLSHFAKYATAGDYIVVEDTNPLGPKYSCMTHETYTSFGEKKLLEVEKFVNVYPKFKVDSYYTDLFGYNSTWQWNSILCHNS